MTPNIIQVIGALFLGRFFLPLIAIGLALYMIGITDDWLVGCLALIALAVHAMFQKRKE